MSALAASYIDFQQRGGIADLGHRAKFRLTGADRVRYLNGQVTANVSRLQPGQALRACVTSAKGRLNGDVVISSTADALLLDAEPELRESLLSRLERYIVADDVTLEDVTDTLGLFHLLPSADETIEALLSSAPGATQPRTSLRYGRPGVDFFVPIAIAGAVYAEFIGDSEAAACGTPAQAFLPTGPRVPLSPDLLETLRIEAGVPRWGRELQEETLPPEAGLDRTHVDYEKGCYIGQEVVSRLKSVGHVNRRLMGFTSAASEPGDAAPLLAAGMRLFSLEDETKEVGVLTSATWSFALAKPIALGYLKRGSPSGEYLARTAHSLRGADLPAVPPATPVQAQELPFL